MKYTPIAALVTAAVATALSGAPLSQASASASPDAIQISIDQNETPTRWFVELAGPPIVKGVTPAAVARERAAFRRAAAAAGIEFEDRFEFETLWNGLSVEASFATAGKLRALPGVKAIFPVVEFDAPIVPAQSGADVEASTALTRADIARADLGLTGEGIKVAIIDTGIDYDHPDLGGGFGPGYKVAYGYDFVGDDYHAGIPGRNIPVPGPDPDDCNGHGTHVAGIVGAAAPEGSDSGINGVAPGVTLGAYRVFGCEGSSSADVIIAALERAYLDGMDVINQSLGAAFQWPEYPTATVGDRLVEQGVVVIASAGNSGTSGTFSLGAPGVGKDVIGVASFDNVSLIANVFEASGRDIGYAEMTFSTAAPTAGGGEIVYIGRACNGDVLLADPEGKIALSVRGVCAFSEKAANAVAAGATAVIIQNNAPGLFFGTLGAAQPFSAPVVSISQADGNYLLSLEAPVEITWTDRIGNVANPTAGLTSSFSSWGLAPTLDLKPDLGAPGGFIYSTFPLELGGYATLSGTSMSAPHVAGAVALLLEAKPETRAADVRDILQNTARPTPWSLNAGIGFLEPVARQGAGMIDVVAAISNPVHVSPGKLSLGESEAGPHDVTLTLTNSSDEDLTFTLGAQTNVITASRSIPAGPPDAPGPDGIGYFGGTSGVAFEEPTVTVPAGGTAIVQATVFTADAQDLIYGGYITLTRAGSTLRVPYAGYLGDYQAINPLSEDAFGGILPTLATLADGLYSLEFEGASYTMQGDNVPYFLFNVSHPIERLEFEILDAATERRVHPVFPYYFSIDYLGRNSTRGTFFAVSWDGTREHSAGNADLFKILPNGDYKMNIRALKANGDRSNPDHWEIWTSPVISIARPEEPKKTTINLRGNGRP